jgi:pimeloyl-ACP methyl ester carboxylesterase
VLVLHGGAQSAATWRGVCRQLPDALRCIVPDHRGHGESDWSEQGDYACASQVADLLGLLDALELDRFAIVGHSMGGLNALELAGGQPGRASAMVLADVGLDSNKTGRERLRRRAPGPGDTGSSEDERMAASIGALPAQPEPGSARPPFDTRLLPHVPTYCGDGAYRRRLLRAAGAPLLVLRGEHSRILPFAAARTTADFVDGDLVEIPDTGHDIPGRPEATARAIARFLEANP